MNPETKLKIRVLRFLNENYPDSFFYKTSDRFKSGIPDIYGTVAPIGRTVAIELKSGKNKATPLQLYFLDLIKKAGGATAVCYSVDEVNQFMKGLSL